MVSGSVRLTMYFKRPLDLPLLSKELAKNGFWSAEVLPKADGTFEILAPEPGLIGIKPGEPPEIPAYKVYVTPDALSLTIFGGFDNFKDYVSEMIAMITEVGMKEDEIEMGEIVAVVEDELSLCDMGEVEGDFLGKMKVNGIVLTSGNKAVSVAPINEEKRRYLVTITQRDSWAEVRKSALVLHPLYSELKEVIERWTCRK
ncbi:hypothetical protein IPA_08240 [Ignicoccus pacificus DSM 13166]|uniref:Uncharacterized protein n=1 Tax=Ignicoccus pacificus DSM 13166 TaxID=940294 RepID=A0A977PLA4_9CREN|nr:hypothetical protein IPA_08240 [Ignicoccus pacificus DSM 13166]